MDDIKKNLTRLPRGAQTRPGRDGRSPAAPGPVLSPEGVSARAVIRDIEASIARLDEACETAQGTSRPAVALSHLWSAREHMRLARESIAERHRAALSPNRAIGA